MMDRRPSRPSLTNAEGSIYCPSKALGAMCWLSICGTDRDIKREREGRDGHSIDLSGSSMREAHAFSIKLSVRITLYIHRQNLRPLISPPSAVHKPTLWPGPPLSPSRNIKYSQAWELNRAFAGVVDPLSDDPSNWVFSSCAPRFNTHPHITLCQRSCQICFSSVR